MVQIPIMTGNFTDLAGSFRTALPRNLVTVPAEIGISNGYLRPASGIVARGVVPGPAQGCQAWRGVMYAVCAGVFGRVNADYTWTPILELFGSGRAVFAYSFDKLGFTFGGRFYLSDGVTAARVIDPDLGTVVSVAWIDGYFVLTDGEFIITTDLTDPTQIDPLKYGSAESSPDPVVGVIRVGSEVASVGTNTIEYFSNVGGAGFPFQRVPGAVVQKGAVNSNAFVAYLGGIAFIGGADGEPNAVWVAGNGSAERLSTREIETLLDGYSADDMATVWLSTRTDLGHVTLFLHFPDKTLAYDARASAAVGNPVWFELNSGYGWRVSAQAWCYGDWVVFDTDAGAVGVSDLSLSSHWGATVEWEFSTPIIYNASARAIIHELELVALPGRAAFGVNPTIGTKYSTDGITWSQPKFISAGADGDRTKRLRWLQQGPVQNWRIQKFFGTSAAHLSIARLEANIEGMAW